MYCWIFFVVTLGFFDDIQIPASCLQHPSKFDEEEQVWIWEYENQGQKHNLYMDIGMYSFKNLFYINKFSVRIIFIYYLLFFPFNFVMFSLLVGEKIKFRIMSEIFMETSPDIKISDSKSVLENKIPYLLIVSTCTCTYLCLFWVEFFTIFPIAQLIFHTYSVI